MLADRLLVCGPRLRTELEPRPPDHEEFAGLGAERATGRPLGGNEPSAGVSRGLEAASRHGDAIDGLDQRAPAMLDLPGAGVVKAP